MSPTNGLTIAVPRGALFDGTVDLLSALGIDTDELRSNDRKLLFEDIGVITMRPSDVPTYVEAGAADLGITGKDVLLEQAAQRPEEGGREVYELLDLGFGRCTMVLASKAGPDPAMEALRRLGVSTRGSPPGTWRRPGGRPRSSRSRDRSSSRRSPALWRPSST